LKAANLFHIKMQVTSDPSRGKIQCDGDTKKFSLKIPKYKTIA